MSNNTNPVFDKALNRRNFLTTAAGATGVLLFAPIADKASSIFIKTDIYTVGQIMDMFTKQVPGGALKDTVDTLKSGNRNIKVKGIVTAMFATV